MTTTRLFKSNKTQAVRLPKDVAFDDDVSEVQILIDGDARVLVPAGKKWDWFFSHLATLGDDFPDRDQPPIQERASIDEFFGS